MNTPSPVTHRRRPNSLTPSKNRTTPTSSTSHRSPPPPPQPPSQGRSSSACRGRSSAVKPPRNPLSDTGNMLQLTFSEESSMIVSLVNECILEEQLEKKKKKQNSSGGTGTKANASTSAAADNGRSSKQQPEKENIETKKQLQGVQHSLFTLAEAGSFDTASTAVYNDLKVSHFDDFDTASTTAYNDLRVVSYDDNMLLNRDAITDTANTDISPKAKMDSAKSDTGSGPSRGTTTKDTSLINALGSITNVFTTHMDIIQDTKKSMDLTLAKHMASFASEMKYARAKAEAEAIVIVDHHIERNRELEQQLVTVNRSLELTTEKCNEIDKQRKKSRAETQEVKEELMSAHKLVVLRSQELKDEKNRMEQQVKENEQTEEHAKKYLAEIRKLNKKLDDAHMENKNLKEKLLEANDVMTPKLEEANSENQRLEGAMDDAHAKLVAIADAYKAQQKTIEMLEQKIQHNAQGANDKLKSALSRILDAECRQELPTSENEKLKKKLGKVMELYQGELSKCNKAAAAYKKNSKFY